MNFNYFSNSGLIAYINHFHMLTKDTNPTNKEHYTEFERQCRCELERRQQVDLL